MQQTAATTLFQHFSSLTVEFSRLSAQLSLAARELQDPGRLPDLQLQEHLTTASRDFSDLCARGLTVAESLALAPLPTVETLASLSDLKVLLQAVAKAEEERSTFTDLCQRAVMVLDRVLQVHHREQEAFAPLLDCQARARDLHNAVAEAQWPNLHPATESLAAGEDPFSDFLAWVERQDELDDEQWALLQDSVTQSFSKALAVAVSRGKLVVPAKEGQTTAERETLPPSLPAFRPETTPPCAIQVEEKLLAPDFAIHKAQALEVAQAAEPSIVVAVGDEGEMDSATALDAANFLFPMTADEQQEDASAPSFLLYQSGLEDSAQKIAALLQENGRAETRPAALQDLIWRLLYEDKVSLAFHLTCYVETQLPERRFQLPSWLLRAVVLSRHVRRARGEIARFLEEDFDKFSSDMYGTEQKEWSYAVGFLLASAALQPALLAPQTRASALLRSLPWKEDLPQFFSYCQRIAEYGESLQPLDPNSVKKGKEQTTRQAEVDVLKQAVELWWSRAQRLSLNYVPATKVWQKWLEPKGLLSTLVAPIRNEEPNKLPAVKRILETCTDDAQIKREIEHIDREVLGRRLGDDMNGRSLEQLRTYVREAVGFARRWVDLQEFPSGQHKDLGQEQAEQLRQAVWSQHSAVVEELNLFNRRHPSLPMRSGITCCRKVLENIQQLFDPEASFPTEEPLPRPLVYADLLRIPSVALNEQWEVEESDWEALVDGILELVVNTTPKRAFA